MMQAMFVSFGMAQHLNGDCILRFDDTNPEAEKQEYIDHIQDIVSWMGWTPSKVCIPTFLHCPHSYTSCIISVCVATPTVFGVFVNRTTTKLQPLLLMY